MKRSAGTRPGRSLAGVAVALITTIAACASRPGGENVTYDLPTRELFFDGNVSGFLEARCGALDCHGSTARPLRIYGQYGLRRELGDGGARDRGPTSDLERLENFRSVVGLEPEELAKAVASGGTYTGYMLVTKPLDIQGGGVRHKGGPVLAASNADPGWACLTGWIAGNTSIAPQCRDAADVR